MQSYTKNWKTFPLLDISLQYYGPLELKLCAPLEFCLTARFVQYRRSILSLETALYIIFHPLHFPQSFGASAQRLKYKECTGYVKNTNRTSHLVQKEFNLFAALTISLRQHQASASFFVTQEQIEKVKNSFAAIPCDGILDMKGKAQVHLRDSFSKTVSLSGTLSLSASCRCKQFGVWFCKNVLSVFKSLFLFFLYRGNM